MPRPQQKGTGLADHLALARNNAGRPAAIPADKPTSPRTVDSVVEPDPVDRTALEKAFHRALVQGYQEMKRQIGYNATIYIQMISKSGGLGAARQLLQGQQFVGT